MKRRNKKDMEEMRSLVEYYLLFAGNDPQLAYNNYIKEHLLNNIQLPYYVKGLKDFIKISQEIKMQNDAEERQKKSKKSMEEKKAEFISNFKIESVKDLLKQYKGTNKYSTIVEFWMALQEDKPAITNGLYMDLMEIIK